MTGAAPLCVCRSAPEAGPLLAESFSPRAPLLVRLLLAGVVGALPNNRIPEVADALVGVLGAMQANGLQMLASAMESIPESSATREEKSRVVSAAEEMVRLAGSYDSRAFQDAVYDLADITRRNGKARLDAQLPLMPPEIASAAVLRR